jgi:lactam utilization protein B
VLFASRPRGSKRQAFYRVAAQLAYVKPHSALYNDLLRSDELRNAVLAACASFRPNLPLMVPPQYQHRHGRLGEQEYPEHLGASQ